MNGYRKIGFKWSDKRLRTVYYNGAYWHVVKHGDRYDHTTAYAGMSGMGSSYRPRIAWFPKAWVIASRAANPRED